MLELAFATPMLMLMLSGVIDFGRAYYFTDAAVSAARAGAQYGIESPSNFGNYAGMRLAAQNDAQGIANFSASGDFVLRDFRRDYNGLHLGRRRQGLRESDYGHHLQSDDALAGAAQSSEHRRRRHHEVQIMAAKPAISRRRLRHSGGNAIVESGLSFLVCMTIFIAIFEFGMAIFTYNFVSYAAREGARWAATRGSLAITPATETASKQWSEARWWRSTPASLR